MKMAGQSKEKREIAENLEPKSGTLPLEKWMVRDYNIYMYYTMYVAKQCIHGSPYTCKGIPVESTPSNQTTQPLFHFEVLPTLCDLISVCDLSLFAAMVKRPMQLHVLYLKVLVYY
jgi:hypothetical protein